MAKRGDRDHDIAAWFGVNQGRIAEAKEGKFGTGQPAAAETLPPKGPPGIKGRRLRGAVRTATERLSAGDAEKAIAMLQKASEAYDANEA
jgi:hypothetical protein